MSEDHVRVAEREQRIAEIQKENAEATVDFLTNKFTNVKLYDWISRVLESIYSFFLQQATSLAKLAVNQLVFERQEIPPDLIQDDYWGAVDDGGTIGTVQRTNRYGLTGSARLLRDIHQVDEYAFETNKRKLQLTKTISLSRLVK
ncbi:hypothetical protein ACFOU2_19730 [Bacillus songklensis]|uniref:Tc toxin complex TcA C-terminal TcB-binding domain-containing protein n=1 Tax=Bacillus songklensis TaxID=1069116 RepID=A0ABV8B8P7_9BACI